MEIGEAVVWQYAQRESEPSQNVLRHRKSAPLLDTLDQDPFEELVKQTSTLSLAEKQPENRSFFYWKYVVSPLLLTALSAYVRFYGITNNHSVVWDEAHFGKFGSYYIQREFYFDVHPPLGKLLVGLSGYLAGFDGEFKFESGQPFPPGYHFMRMRQFNCVFSVLCTPLAYFTGLELGYSTWTAWYVTLSVALEMLSLTLSKFILLDSMLLFFTVLTFFCLSKLHTLTRSDSLLSLRGLAWLAISGVSIGCVCSVKWVGLFVTLLFGFYTIYDLLVKFFQTTVDPKKLPGTYMSIKKYIIHWLTRAVFLIAVPFLIYVVAFRVHFAVLSKSGTGDGLISTLLQASLEGNTLKNGPRSVAYGSLVTLRSQGLSPNLLHSHPSLYPEGSRQQQITTYGFKDDNNEFLLEFDMLTSLSQNRFATLDYDDQHPDYVLDYTRLVKDGDIIRLKHKNTGCFLHSHPIAAAVLSNQYEVSCYGGITINDDQDDWVVEVQTQDRSPSVEFQNESSNELHPISTNFRLRHKVVGCYLATSGHAYPAWGFQQGEVMCKNSFLTLDKSTWWNFEDHVNEHFPTPETPYVAPKPKFWKEFILLNYGMMASNNALVPDPDHFDHLVSSWWEWPILKSGLRMNSWGPGSYRYFLIGNPFVTIFSTLCIFLAALTFGGILFAWQRQIIKLGVFSDEWGFILAGGILPFLGWILHYLPFVVMGRVTYLHHYVPALYFAIFVSGFLVEYFIARRTRAYFCYIIFLILYACIICVFWYYKPLAMGMLGSANNYKHLKLYRSWNI
ncbi:PMT-domain-containing protein [Metschnikowia bicuspidata var. bicuspidata NRRL YB-4993]|uniref:Dolichyl-phosphate-mannose--protein mannosyltransferase n=1 Tax=Metschnikowia bicuspidata var. bicuspidata NRRL YB-4993 TaxID=869754 RepID=A0A1A0HF41_9ASCO|nr:PMT-domain-containing protein [Metschnikowia bicuspidata var. bicuspidata NRRL YB-4993]OBA22749.1 PMT-domain-containing protein [Metschnikowia bicuspidata var. bicuspidata NRRL YB-4993]